MGSVMISFNGISRLVTVAFVLLLAACGGQQAREPLPSMQPEIRQFDFEAAAKKPIPADAFGANPYLQTATVVPEAAITEYRFAVEALRGGNQDLAEQQLLEMIERYPELSGPAYNLAVLKKQQGDTEAANEYLDIALNRNYANFDARNMKALMLREAGDFDQAEQMYQDIIRSWGGYKPAYRNLGILYDLYMGRAEDALVYYRQYNYMLEEPDPQVEGWIVDIERRYGVKHMDLQAVKQAEAKAREQAALAAQNGEQVVEQAEETEAAPQSDSEQPEPEQQEQPEQQQEPESDDPANEAVIEQEGG